MDHLRVNTHKDLSAVAEKYYGFTVRQWIFMLLGAALGLVVFLSVKDVLGFQITQYLVVLVSVPIMAIGFVRLQGLSLLTLLPFWKRHYWDMGKPMKWKDDAQISKKKGGRSSVSKKERKKGKRQDKEAEEPEKAKGRRKHRKKDRQ